MEKVIITAAVVGGDTTREKNPNVPITPKEIAESAVECFREGASVCHIHVRDPNTHKSSMKFELYEEVFKRIHDNCDMIINLSTGPGGRLIYDAGASGTVWNLSELKSPDERVEHILKLKPELCSLDVGSLNFGSRVFVNVLAAVERMAALIQGVGTKPELEVFEGGHIRIAKHLIRKGLVKTPSIFQLCLGIPWGMEADIPNMVYMVNNLPSDSIWYSFAIGHNQFDIASGSIIMGGHARVGFEDNVYISKGILAKSNAEMVRKVVGITNILGREVANATEARKILGLTTATENLK